MKTIRFVVCGVVLMWALVAMARGQDTNVIKLMFGKETTDSVKTNFLDFTYVTPAATLTEGQPWGWIQTNKINAWVFNMDQRCSVPPDVLLEHVVFCHNGVFGVRMPNGRVTVHLWVGEVYGLGRIWASYRVRVDNKIVLDEHVTHKNINSERWYLRGQSEVYRKDTDHWVRQVKPILDEYDFEVEVTNGVLALQMENVNLCAMLVAPAADTGRMKTALAEVEKARREQYAQRYPWKPQPDEPMPAVRSRDEKRGYIMFQKFADDEVYPWTRPTNDEITDTIRGFAAQGEQEPLRFGILPLKELKAFAVEVGDFASPEGSKIKVKTQADLWAERYTERGCYRARGGISMLDPVCDVLMKAKPTDYEPGLPRTFTLDVRVPTNTPAGFYRAPVIFRSETKEIGQAELQLRVLPWELVFAPVPYSFQAVYVHWFDNKIRKEKNNLENRHRINRRRMEARVRFIGKYGFSASYFEPMRGWATIKGEPGNRHYTQTPEQAAEMDWWYQLVMNDGNARQWIQFHFCHALWFRAGWNMGQGIKEGWGNPNDSKEKHAIDRQDLVRIIREYEEICRKKGYPKHYWYSCGEPDNHPSSPEEGVEMAKVIHDAGAEALCTLNGANGARLDAPVHDIVLANAATPITEGFIKSVKNAGHKFGSHNTGCTRLAAGYQFWRLDGVSKFQEVILYVDMMLPYAYLPWNYYKGDTGAAVYPTEDGLWRPTIRWLRYRDGRDDFMYMWNLEQRLAKAKAVGLDQAPAVKNADAFVRSMREKIYVDPRKYSKGNTDAKEAGSNDMIGWNPKRFARYRWAIAMHIMELDNVLRTKGQKP